MRVQIDQGGIAPPVVVTIGDPEAADAFFAFQRNLTPEYVRRREAYDKAARDRRETKAKSAAKASAEH
jgi:hypothetical protein